MKFLCDFGVFVVFLSHLYVSVKMCGFLLVCFAVAPRMGRVD